MFEICNICGIKFADITTVKEHHGKAHTLNLNEIATRFVVVEPKVISPTRTSNKSIHQITTELEAKLGTQHFFGYLAPITMEKKPQLVQVNRNQKFENAYVSFAKNIGKFVVNKHSVQGVA